MQIILILHEKRIRTGRNRVTSSGLKEKISHCGQMEGRISCHHHLYHYFSHHRHPPTRWNQQTRTQKHQLYLLSRYPQQTRKLSNHSQSICQYYDRSGQLLHRYLVSNSQYSRLMALNRHNRTYPEQNNRLFHNKSVKQTNNALIQRQHQ